MARLRFIGKNEAAKPGAGSKQEASAQEIDLVEELKRLIQRMAPDLAVSVRSKPDFYVGQANTLPGLEIALERDSRPKYNIVLDGDTWRIFFPGVRRKSITGDATKGEASVTAVAKWIMDDLGRRPEGTSEAKIPTKIKEPGSMDRHSTVDYYSLYEIDKDGDELDDIASGSDKDVISALKKALGENPKGLYHIVAIWKEKGHTESEVVWSNLADECRNEAVLNRVTMKDVRKALSKLQKDGQLDKALHEVTALITYVGNHLANTDPDVKDNKLNAPERKIVARAVLAHIAEQFGYQPEDLR